MKDFAKQQSHLSRRATILKYKDGIVTLRVQNRSDGCHGCGNHKQGNCALYTYGSLFSRRRDIRQLPSSQPFERGTQVQLTAHSTAVLKIALSCYGLPVLLLLASTTLAHVLWQREWLTVLAALLSLGISFMFAKRWLRSICTPSIRLIQ